MDGNLTDICIKQIETKITNFFDNININDIGEHIDLCKLPENKKLALKYRVYWSFPDLDYKGCSLEIVIYSEEFKWVGRDYYSEDEELLKELTGDLYEYLEEDEFQEVCERETKKIIKWCNKYIDRLRLGDNIKIKLKVLARKVRERVIKKVLDKTCLYNDLQNHIIKFLL